MSTADWKRILKDNSVEQWVSIKEASELLQCSVKSIRRLLDQHKLQGKRDGKFWKFSTWDLLKVAVRESSASGDEEDLDARAHQQQRQGGGGVPTRRKSAPSNPIPASPRPTTPESASAAPIFRAATTELPEYPEPVVDRDDSDDDDDDDVEDDDADDADLHPDHRLNPRYGRYGTRAAAHEAFEQAYPFKKLQREVEKHLESAGEQIPNDASPDGASDCDAKKISAGFRGQNRNLNWYSIDEEALTPEVGEQLEPRHAAVILQFSFGWHARRLLPKDRFTQDDLIQEMSLAVLMCKTSANRHYFLLRAVSRAINYLEYEALRGTVSLSAIADMEVPAPEPPDEALIEWLVEHHGAKREDLKAILDGSFLFEDAS